MGDRLKVDLAELASTAAGLTALISNFASSSEKAEEIGGDLGHPDLSDAMHAFATNWSYHKAKLVELLEGVRDMAQEGHTTYVGVDDHLAAELVSASQRPVGQ